MVRLARVVAQGIPHHITQRGNRRQETFFCAEDYQAYSALRGGCRSCAVEVWAYCLMPNRVHFIAAPDSDVGLRRAIGEAQRRYTRRVNVREGWRSHVWQDRFACQRSPKLSLLTEERAPSPDGRALHRAERPSGRGSPRDRRKLPGAAPGPMGRGETTRSSRGRLS
jgi:REP element-mobilizing transposase RayT